MTFDPNDARLTAYVLDELEPADRAEVERMLEGSAECRQAVAEIRSTAGWLTERLHEEQASHAPASATTNHQPVTVMTGPSPAAPAADPSRWRSRLLLGAVAATLLLAATIALVPMSKRVKGPRPDATSLVLATDGEVSRFNNATEARHDPVGVQFTDGMPATLGKSEIVLRSMPPAAAKSSQMMAGASGGGGMMGGMGGGMMTQMQAPTTAPVQRYGKEKRPEALVRAQNFQGRMFVTGPQTPTQGQASANQNASQGKQGQAQRGMTLASAPQQPGQRFRGDSFSIEPGASANTGKPDQGPQHNGPVDESLLARKANSSPPAVQLQLKNGLPARSEAEQNQPRDKLAKLSENEGEFERSLNEPESLPAPAAPQSAPMAQAAVPPPALPAEAYAPIVDNTFQAVEREAQSTFSIDVDTASYANVRRFLNQNMLPPGNAVRIEELLNYFPYGDAPPAGASEDPFAIHLEIARCPWNAQHRLARIGIAARPIDQSRRPASNLVFLIDVSGSMDDPRKLPLVQWGLQRLVEQLGENDRVAIVVYASASGLVLPSTSCIHKVEVLSAIENLHAGGSTNGGAGIQLAYDIATRHFIKNGTNRVILATDGDFNDGVTDNDQLVKLIEAKAKSGTFLSVLGFGMGNIKDDKLEKLADKGNGHYAYIDSPREAYKVLVEEMGANLITVAKDVKIQVDFNLGKVSAYRLIGYENRRMPNEDFADDTKDAGEIGAGHHVTALYELVPAPGKPGDKAEANVEAFTFKLRYKKPDADISRLIERKAVDSGLNFPRASDDLKFATAVAGFGMMLRGSPHKGTLTYAGLLEIAQPALARDPSGYRKEFVELVRKAQALSSRAAGAP